MLTTLSLASVCRYWRVVTCSFDVLWSYIAYTARDKKDFATFMEHSCSALTLSVCEDSLDLTSHRELGHDLPDEGVFSPYSIMLLDLFRIETNHRYVSRQYLVFSFRSPERYLEDLEMP